jgi:DNA repair and recombination protein RAD54B
MGKDMGRTAFDGPLLPESTLKIGGKDVEVEAIMPREEYIAGRHLLNRGISKPPALATTTSQLPTPRVPLPKMPPKAAIEAKKEDAKKTLNVAAPKSIATNNQWKNPMLVKTIMPKHDGDKPTPRHDPTAPGALIMKRPKAAPKGKQIVDVVMDPLLSRHLRDHQREGVKFLYECVMGLRNFEGEGAILADEMGLGKTLQTIALIWTLLKQNPIYEENPVVKKALIVCPATLINNWRKEFRKWLGDERIGIYVVDNTKTRLSDFMKSRSYQVMIIGYEKLRNVQEELRKGSGIDIVIADEGHRLKTAENKSAQAIKSLNTAKRIILSGTPIQNDLREFFWSVELVNPGLLGTFKSFTKNFETPIMKSRQPEATEKEVEKGEARSEELAELTSHFILRRTADVLAKYLPPKTEYVVLCRPTPVQATVYSHVLASPLFQSALGSTESQLQLITILKKVCNGPKLLGALSNNDPDKVLSPMTASLISSIPTNLLLQSGSSTKIRVLDQLLHTLRTTTTEKVVIVSNFTSTLNFLETLLQPAGMMYLRLDGSTPSAKRQDLVDHFNRAPASEVFAFLLSAKAGGMGINLIGASRLILFDVDWNPAIDLQAMARIHRDGQKKPCIIYRLLMAGGLDEKIWQRQVTKLGLASSVMDQKGGTSSFTRDELKDLFRLDESSICQTHDFLCCGCGGRGLPDVTVNMDGPGSATSPDAEDEWENEAKEGKDEDEASLPDLEDFNFPKLVKSSHVDMEQQERQIKEAALAARNKGTKGKMQSLMNYSHIDTSQFKTVVDEDMEALIGDDVLLDVIKDEATNVSFVFAKIYS